MYHPNIEQLMILITSVDEKASIKYSTVTGMFYVSSEICRMEEHQRYMFSSEHRPTIDAAVRDYYKMIRGKLVKLTNSKQAYKLPILVR